MTTDTWTITDTDRATLLHQIGRGNILAISGGRVRPLPDGVELPVSNGYSVRVRLTPADDYTVARVFTRSGRETLHGVRDRTYCDEVGEAAYRASSFRSYDEAEWVILPG